MKRLMILCAMMTACAEAPEDGDVSQNSVAAQNYAWMVGHWNCDSLFNGYSTVTPQFKLHHVTADYRFTLLEDATDHLLVHEEYREQTVEPGFPVYDYDADITVDLANPPGPQGHTSTIVGTLSDGSTFTAAGALNGRTTAFLGNYSYHGTITTAIDGKTRTWTRVGFGSDPDLARRPFGDYGDNFRIQVTAGGTQQDYLGTDCVKDQGHEPGGGDPIGSRSSAALLAPPRLPS